jgi:hypothetical protein
MLLTPKILHQIRDNGILRFAADTSVVSSMPSIIKEYSNVNSNGHAVSSFIDLTLRKKSDFIW